MKSNELYFPILLILSRVRDIHIRRGEARLGTVGHEPDGGVAPDGPGLDIHARHPVGILRLVLGVDG